MSETRGDRVGTEGSPGESGFEPVSLISILIHKLP